MIDQNVGKKDWAKQRPEVFALDGDPPEEPILWTPITGESHGQMRKRLLAWAGEADFQLTEILKALFFQYPRALPVLVLADHLGVMADESLNKLLAHLEALGLVQIDDRSVPHVQATDSLFSSHEQRIDR